MSLNTLALPRFRYETAVGAAIPLLLRLRQRGLGTGVDVSTATQIALEWERDEVNGTPIIASALTSGANWAVGDVVVPISLANVTAVQGTVEVTLVVTWGSNVWPAALGIIDVVERFGFV